MSYLVLARKYRPNLFSEVVRQEHVTKTLQNAISSNRVAHALLFTGPRGTGKTTVARILAKTMNCENGPAPEPCNACDSCLEITRGGAADVFEIDGASNNGVDHIRDLRDNTKYMPAHSPYKIYIIDEVHMLSTQAFNALLKTLEEPPPHIMFIFATTEPNKIPITILSRCQRHDFRRVDMESIAEHLKKLCELEGFDIPHESIDLLARESGGSVRDSLSLLDQVMTGSMGKTTHDQILDMLGVVDRKILFEISSAVLKGEVSTVLNLFADMYQSGRDFKVVYTELVDHFRNLLIVKMNKHPKPLVDLPHHEIAAMGKQVETVTVDYLITILDILFREETSIRLSNRPKTALEMAFFRMFRVRPVLPIDTLIEKIDQVRKEILQGRPDLIYPPDPEKNGELEQSKKQRREKTVSDASGNPPTQSAIAEVSPPKSASTVSEPRAGFDTDPQVPKQDESGIRFDASLSEDDNWQAFIQAVSKTNISLGAILSKSEPPGMQDNQLDIRVSGGVFAFNRVKKLRHVIEEVATAFFGKKMKVAVEQEKKNTPKKKTTTGLNEIQRKEALEHPLVKEVVEIFQGRIVDITLL